MSSKAKLVTMIAFCLIFMGMVLPSVLDFRVKAQTPGPTSVPGGGSSGGSDSDDSGSPPAPPDMVNPGVGKQDGFDPGGASDIRFDFPPNAVSVPIQIKAFYTDVPPSVSSPPNGIVGSPFYFGAWIRGEGKTVDRFNQSIVVKVPYDDDDLAFGQNSTPPGAEDSLRLTMYDPAAETWLKLCNRVDTSGNRVAAALILPTPLQDGENALFALTVDETPELNQQPDSQGNTLISIPANNFTLSIMPGTVDAGVFFEITRLLDAQNAGPLRLLPTPVDLKACQADYRQPSAIRQVTQFPKPLNIEFSYDIDTTARAGDKFNLTIANRQQRQWDDMEEFGYTINRNDGHIDVNSNNLGAFALAVRGSSPDFETQPEAILAKSQNETTASATSKNSPPPSTKMDQMLPVTGESFNNGRQFLMLVIVSMLVIGLLVGGGLWKMSQR